MAIEDGVRAMDEGMTTDFRGRMDYGDYLALDELLSAQHPISDHHDEPLFIIQHQTTELWLKLALHELRAVRSYLEADDVRRARKGLARVKHVFHTITDQWSVLATLTPSEYTEFRGVLGNASGFQSHQYRAVEFVLGNKDERVLRVFEARPHAHDLLAAELEAPTVYDAFLRHLARAGHPVPEHVLHRDVRRAWVQEDALVPVYKAIYEDTAAHWAEYATCEDLVDLEDAVQLWRFRHLRTVQRTIGFKPGTGGSSGVGFLRRALDLTFFPELYAVRTQIGT
ncbi:tryptophan 2,3-dioxygenase [Geodermatophilus dictyosporus]|uniref:Tryptophan 2,3-dioxygenase n=1 Tax=Geodermatophilus dictyosporus TaxID=1523247 RepID=A0A1I5JN68_9ACTN|nr:tryptophan 2,3-dioxygenase family protein [Geodermatophilus dictyosporus]SFO74150.1 tryptophan 2,3-dioxygenase [Geodermatophilus dictyosporus]